MHLQDPLGHYSSQEWFLHQNSGSAKQSSALEKKHCGSKYRGYHCRVNTSSSSKDSIGRWRIPSVEVIRLSFWRSDVPLAVWLLRTGSADSELTLCSSFRGKRLLSDILVRFEGFLLSAFGVPVDSGPDGAEGVTEGMVCWFCDVWAWLRLFLEALRRIMTMRFLLSRASTDFWEAVDVSASWAPTKEEKVVVTCWRTSSCLNLSEHREEERERVSKFVTRIKLWLSDFQPIAAPQEMTVTFSFAV